MSTGRLLLCGFAQLAWHKDKVNALRAPMGMVAFPNFCNSGPKVVMKEEDLPCRPEEGVVADLLVERVILTLVPPYTSLYTVMKGHFLSSCHVEIFQKDPLSPISFSCERRASNIHTHTLRLWTPLGKDQSVCAHWLHTVLSGKPPLSPLSSLCSLRSLLLNVFLPLEVGNMWIKKVENRQITNWASTSIICFIW